MQRLEVSGAVRQISWHWASKVQCMLELTEATLNEVLEQITFVLAYLTIFSTKEDQLTVLPLSAMPYIHTP